MAADTNRRSTGAKIAADWSWAITTDRSARTRAARQAAEARWERLVDPDGVMEPEQRAKAVAAAKRAHFRRMGQRSGRTRSAKKAG